MKLLRRGSQLQCYQHCAEYLHAGPQRNAPLEPRVSALDHFTAKISPLLGNGSCVARSFYEREPQMSPAEDPTAVFLTTTPVICFEVPMGTYYWIGA